MPATGKLRMLDKLISNIKQNYSQVSLICLGISWIAIIGGSIMLGIFFYIACLLLQVLAHSKFSKWSQMSGSEKRTWAFISLLIYVIVIPITTYIVTIIGGFNGLDCTPNCVNQSSIDYSNKVVPALTVASGILIPSYMITLRKDKTTNKN